MARKDKTKPLGTCINSYTLKNLFSEYKTTRKNLDSKTRESFDYQLIMHQECLAISKRNELFCNVLEPFSDEDDDDSLQNLCRANYSWHTFMALSLDDNPGNNSTATEYCMKYLSTLGIWKPNVPRGDKYICETLAHAYRSSYYPACSYLSTQIEEKLTLSASDFHFLCRTTLYPDTRSCNEVKSVQSRHECEISARLLNALKNKKPAMCGDFPVCEAASRLSAGVCARLEKDIIQTYCRIKNDNI